MDKLQKYALIGHPVGHSYSPTMHNAAFEYLGIEAEYELFDVSPEDLEEFLREKLTREYAGCNVTIPHKIAVRDFIEREGKLTEDAKRIGAVNTIAVKGSQLLGDNTDGKGFTASLEKDLKFDPRDKTVCVIGAGGAARSIVMSLGKLPKKIYVIGIIQEQLDELKQNYLNCYKEREKLETSMTKDLKKRAEFARKSDLLVNATPVGMKHKEECVIDEEALHDNLAVFDVVYNPLETELIKMAKKNGIKQVTNGIGMLLYQGALSFELWTHKKPPIVIMKNALKAKIEDESFM